MRGDLERGLVLVPLVDEAGAVLEHHGDHGSVTLGSIVSVLVRLTDHARRMVYVFVSMHIAYVVHQKPTKAFYILKHKI